MRQLGLSATKATSGRQKSEDVALQSSIRLIDPKYLHPTSKYLGSGKFGTCTMVLYSHFKACKKVYKRTDYGTFCIEANILSKFASRQLPYLFGVCIADNTLVVSFHGLRDTSVTLHSALSGKAPELLADYFIDWRNILVQILEAVDELHSVYEVLHNDIKSDNIVLEADTSSSIAHPVIIDFGKACDVGKGKMYHLSPQERENYMVNHPHIAPDVRDGLCAQSVASDIFAYGRIMHMVAVFINENSVETLSKKCMLYHSNLRPSIYTLKQSLIVISS